MAKRSISLSLLKLELNVHMRDGTACSYFLIEKQTEDRVYSDGNSIIIMSPIYFATHRRESVEDLDCVNGV